MPSEYRMQLDRLAKALTVAMSLIGNGAVPLRMLVFEWSWADDPALIVSGQLSP